MIEFSNRDTIVFLIIGFIMILSSCGNHARFDSALWKQYSDLDAYPDRESMLKDLVENRELIGLSFDTVIDSLGQPEKYASSGKNELWYPVTIDYGSDIDPVYTKHLVLTVTNDSLVHAVDIREWRRGD